MGEKVIDPVIEVFQEKKDLFQRAAERIIRAAEQTINAQGDFRIALSGGSTPEGLYRMLASTPWKHMIDWKRVSIFWGDERCVHPTDENSNFRMASRALIDKVPIPKTNLYPINGELNPDYGAAKYEQALGANPLDFILLGMGSDGHTASLFPDTPNLTSEMKKVVATKSPVPPHLRISLSLSEINRAERVLFMITGEDKAQTLARVRKEIQAAEPALPAAMVRPVSGNLVWLLDEKAASRLDEVEKPS